MLRFHRTTYIYEGASYTASWWQMGDHVFRLRTKALV